MALLSSIWHKLTKKRRGNTFEDPKIMQEAAKRSLEIRQLQAKRRQLEHQRKMADETARIQEMSQDPGQKQMQELFQMFMLFQAFSVKANPENGSSQGMDIMQIMQQFAPNNAQMMGVSAPNPYVSQEHDATPGEETESDLVNEDDIRFFLSKIKVQDLAKLRAMPNIAHSFLVQHTNFSDEEMKIALKVLQEG